MNTVFESIPQEDYLEQPRPNINVYTSHLEILIK